MAQMALRGMPSAQMLGGIITAIETNAVEEGRGRFDAADFFTGGVIVLFLREYRVRTATTFTRLVVADSEGAIHVLDYNAREMTAREVEPDAEPSV